VAHEVPCIVGIFGIIQALQAKFLFGIDGIIQVLYHRIIGIIGIIGVSGFPEPLEGLVIHQGGP
jgi:hypothetical protein